VEECEEVSRGIYENFRTDAQYNGCGPFVVEAGCASLDCEAQLLADCDADCHLGHPSNDWFEPSCHSDY
jgi:hypothetical protein